MQEKLFSKKDLQNYVNKILVFPYSLSKGFHCLYSNRMVTEA